MVISEVLTPHRWASYLDLELSAHENQLAVAIRTDCVSMLNNRSLSLCLHLIKLSLSTSEKQRVP